ncbi:ATP-dependent helicase [Virgibacillus phasianinus]|nr:ATP-dependent helicase [Virgibacillus phasianinus]
MSEIINYLNKEQKQSVLYNGKYLQINAGPGTGKTTTLAAKILYTQSELGIDTEEILGISFSRSAKSQLLHKLEEFSDRIGYGGKPTILTFHSLAHRIIKNGIYCKESRFRAGFQRVSTEEFLNLDQSLIKGLCKAYADRDVVNNALARAYTEIRQGNQLEFDPFNHYEEIDDKKVYNITTYESGRILIKGEELKKYWARVNKIEKIKNVTDYQGMISEAIRLLQLKKLTYNMISSKYNYIFVDEYQDTSLAQEKLLFSIIHNSSHVTIVGDKNQTIYTFNGSNSRNLKRFSDFFSRKDPNNYKMVNLIQNYRSTNEIIELANDFIKEQNIIPYKTRSGFQPTLVETHSIELAATYVANKINELIDNGEYNPSDICVLYRKNSEYYPQGEKVFKKLESMNIAYTKKQSKSGETISLSERIIALSNKYEEEPLDEIISILIEKNENEDLISFVKDAISQGAVDTDDLIDYSVELEESVSVETDDAVIVKTVHDAKGLEYPVVFILYLGDREFPHSSQPDIDEESRLFYVGITRAQNQLYILGKKGIHQESFLDRCLPSNIKFEQYHNSNQEEKNEGFNYKDKSIIDQTTKQLKEAENKEQEELRRLMDLF